MTDTTQHTSTPLRGTLEHLDPHSVVLEGNVRTKASASKEFVQSIRDHGVMVPVYGRRDAQGSLLVRAGQRRVLGAREAGVATVPVYIVEGDESVATRIIEQLIENEHRDVLPQASLVAAWKQLAFEGFGVGAIAKKTGTKAARVKQGLAVAASTAASSAVVEHHLDLEQAAELIEFEAAAEWSSPSLRRLHRLRGAGASRVRARSDRGLVLKNLAKLRGALARRRAITLDKEYFSRAVIGFFYEQGAFTQIYATALTRRTTPDLFLRCSTCAARWLRHAGRFLCSD